MNIVRFNLVDYQFARGVQDYLVRRRVAGEIEDTLLFCQHFPVITLGQRLKLADAKSILPANIFDQYPIRETTRGGLITAHNPGQFIVYPIVDLRKRKLGVEKFINLILDLIIDSLVSFGVDVGKGSDATGVFAHTDGARKKIAYAGLKIVNGVSNHGFSININNDLSIFQEISSCGLAPGDVTSLQKLLGENTYCWREFSEEIEKNLLICFK